MRPTFMGFETAKSAIFTNQKQLDITGNNLANANTNGYTRQRVDRASIAPSSYANRVASAGSRIGISGQGVEALGVGQTRDAFLDKRFRDEYGKASYHGQSANILSDIESAIGERVTDESALYGALKQMNDRLNDYCKEPTTETHVNLVMSSFKNMAQVLQQMDARLTNVANQHIQDLQVTTDRTNELLKQIAHYNKIISEDAVVMTSPENETYGPNELLDQRNLLLDELASYGDIQVTQLGNGAVNVTMGGHPVVTENSYDTLVLGVNDAGSSSQTVGMHWRSTGGNVTLSGGTILASTEIINGRGHNVQSTTESSAQGILYYRDRINTFANALAHMVNNSVPEYDAATGEEKKDANGNIIYKTLLSAKGADGKTNKDMPVSAANISVSDEWTQGGPSYFIYNKDDNGSYKYAQQIKLQLTEGSNTFNSQGETFTGTFAEYDVDMLGKLGSDITFHGGRQEAIGMVADDFLDRRDAISGVNRDEETADMLKFQKSYEAASRLMTVLDDLLDVVINRMGRAGL